jgi:hypothetical protein
MTRVEYDGVRRNFDHLAPSQQAAIIREVVLYARARMRPPVLSVIVEGVDVTKQPELWPAVHRDYRGPGSPRAARIAVSSPA